MSARHTPGPWTAVLVKDSDLPVRYYKIEAADCDVAMAIEGNDANNQGLPNDVEDANARLIASAPEMLAVLERLMTGHDLQGTVDAARDIIAKATVGAA